jgi:Superinfection immunity protein
MALATLIIAGYFLPSLVSVLRHKRNAEAIFVLNLLLGWTLVGWVIALVWAVTVDTATVYASSQAEEPIGASSSARGIPWDLVLGGLLVLFILSLIVGAATSYFHAARDKQASLTTVSTGTPVDTSTMNGWGSWKEGTFTFTKHLSHGDNALDECRWAINKVSPLRDVQFDDTPPLIKDKGNGTFMVYQKVYSTDSSTVITLTSRETSICRVKCDIKPLRNCKTFTVRSTGLQVCSSYGCQ